MVPTCMLVNISEMPTPEVQNVGDILGARTFVSTMCI